VCMSCTSKWGSGGASAMLQKAPSDALYPGQRVVLEDPVYEPKSLRRNKS